MAQNTSEDPWQLSCSEWKRRGSHLLNTGQLSDCTFSVGGVTQKAHKLVLAAASPVFEAMLYGPMVEANTDDPISITDINPDTFKTLLEYLYTDNINIDSFNKAYDLYYGAQKYMLPHLASVCASYISTNLTPQTACKAYELGKLFSEDCLMKESMALIKIKTKEVLQDNSILDVQIETLETIFAQDNLDINSELDLFHAAERYIEGRLVVTPPGTTPMSKRVESVVCIPPSKKMKLDGGLDHSTSLRSVSRKKSRKCREKDSYRRGESTSTERFSDSAESDDGDTESEDDSEEKARKVSRLLQHIRLLTLSPAAFAAGPARSALLPPRDAFALLMHISHPATDAPLPHGYSASRTKRIPRGGESCSHSVSVPIASLRCGGPGIRSAAFYTLDYRWQLVLKRFICLDKDRNKVEYLSVGLACTVMSVRRGWWLSARAHIKLTRGWHFEPLQRDLTIKIRQPETENGEVTKMCEKFIRWDKLVDPLRGFVRDGAFTAHAQLRLEAADAMSTTNTTSTTCGHKSHATTKRVVALSVPRPDDPMVSSRPIRIIHDHNRTS